MVHVSIISRQIGRKLTGRLIWKDMYVVWDKLKDETDDLRESLKRYCEPLP